MYGETWAREQLKNDRPIIFPEEWSEEERQISGAFVIDLLTHPNSADLKLHNAIVTTPVDRRYISVTGEVHFENCVFKAPMSLVLAQFERRARFLGCSFEQDVDLTACSISYLWFDQSELGKASSFNGLFQLLEARITGQLICKKAAFLCPHKPINLNSLKVSGIVFLNNAEFAGPANFAYAKIAGSLELDGAVFRERLDLTNAEISGDVRAGKAQFLHTGQAASLNNARIDGTVLCSEAVFHGPLDLDNCRVRGPAIFRQAVFHAGATASAARFEGSLIFEKAQFLHSEQSANFESIKVGGHALFREAAFHGPVNVAAAELSGILNCQKTQFLSPTGQVNFNLIRVGGIAFLREAVFRGPTSFERSQFGDNLDFSQAEFHRQVSLGGVTVETDLSCEKVQFRDEQGVVSAVGAKIGGSASFAQAVFSGSANAESIRIVGHATLSEATFHGAVNLTAAEVTGILNCQKAQFLSPIGQVNFNLIRVGGIAFLRAAVFRGPTSFERSQFADNLDLSQAEFDSQVNLGRVRIEGDLSCQEVQFHESEKGVNLAGVRVKGHASFQGAAFQGPVEASAAEVDGLLNCVKTRFLNQQKALVLFGAKVGKTAYFTSALFHGGLDLTAVAIGGDASFQQAIFKQSVSFSRSTVEGASYFSETVFEGDVDFTAARIGQSADFQKAQFTGPDRTAVFDELAIAGSALFTGATIQCHVRFVDARLGGNGLFQGVLFKGSATFHRFKVTGAAFFRGEKQLNLAPASFEGEADFSSAQFQSGVDFHETTFRGITSFSASRVSGFATFDGAQFLEGSNPAFNAASFEQGASFQNALFKDNVDFGKARFGGGAFFNAATFQGLVHFGGAEIAGELQFEDCSIHRDLLLQAATFLDTLTLSRAKLKGTLDLSQSTFNANVNAEAIQCTGFANFGSIRVRGQWLSRDADFAGGVAFESAVFEGHAYFTAAKFGESQANLALTRFGPFTDFAQSSFSDKGATFLNATFAGHLVLDEIHSAGPLDFTLCVVEGLLSLSGCRFERDLIFSRSAVKGALFADKALFSDAASFNLTAARVDGPAIFQQCEFRSEVRFDEAVFGDRVEFSVASDATPGTTTPFRRLLSFRSSRISGPLKLVGVQLGETIEVGTRCADFSSAEVLGEFELHHADFLGTTSFHNLKIREGFILGDVQDQPDAKKAETVFHGGVNFSGLTVEGLFSCYRVLFEEQVDFSDLDVSGPTYLFYSRFNSETPTNFNRGKFRGVFGSSSVFCGSVAFEGSRFHAGVRFLRPCTFEGAIRFYFADFEGEANFGGASFKDKVDLSYSTFRRGLQFESGPGSSPKEQTRFDDSNGTVYVDLRWCRYDTLILPTWDPKAFATFLRRINPYDRVPFVSLERFLRSTGRKELADQVRSHWCRIEGNTKILFGGLVWDRLLRYTTNYGTIMWRLTFCVIVLALVALLLPTDFVTKHLHLSPQLSKLAGVSIGGVAAFGAALLGDAFRRRVWPQE